MKGTQKKLFVGGTPPEIMEDSEVFLTVTVGYMYGKLKQELGCSFLAYGSDTGNMGALSKIGSNGLFACPENLFSFLTFFLLSQNGLIKTPSYNCIQMELQLKFEGYFPGTSDVFLDVDDKEKIERLSRHSQKLVIAFGLINTSEGSPIRIG
ncbi:pentatricopeptide (PPR) repeat protein [Artemisia annua]|uniref:Pentatricopeptide (PPR) repeat protein n=1 Tax=Artemisia annua TaxID=35608 RepID=A0A2U1N1B5_ARTAN|nr:pentatricopeptide (PPR) repeat protein [Artemisia annua]